MISSEMTVREVTAQVPESTRLFEKLKIDYCCGGGRPLIEACDSAGVKVDSVIEMLTDLSQSGASESSVADFQKLSLTELVTHIVETHHIFTRSEMSRIEALSAKVIECAFCKSSRTVESGESVSTALCRFEAAHVQRRTGAFPLHRRDGTGRGKGTTVSIRAIRHRQESSLDDDKRTR